MCALLMLTIHAVSVSSTAVTLNTPDPRIPCISLEMSLPIVKIQNSPPSTLDLSFEFSMEKLYSQKYGPTSTTSKRHEKTYNCALQVGKEISELIDRFIIRVLGLIALRKESYIADGRNYDQHADKQTTDRLIRRIRERHSNENSDYDPGERESLKLSRAISELDEHLSFDEFWLEEQVRGDLYRGTNSTDHSPNDSKGRGRRDPATVVSIIVALVSLSATATSTLFLGARLEKLVDYVDTLSEAIESDWQNLKTSYKDLTLLKDGYGSIAAGAHYMTQVIQRLLEYNLCHAQQTRLMLEMRSIAARLDGIFENLVNGRFSTKIMPLSLLREIFTQSSLSSDVLSGAIPTTFYQGASLSVLSADRQRKSVKLLFVSPRIEREPSYRILRLHSVSGTISMNGRIYDRVFGFDGEEIAVPIDLYDKHHDEMIMTAAEVQRLRLPSECSFTNGLYSCRNFLTLPSPIAVCITAVFARDWQKILQQCQVRMIPQNDHHLISTSTGSTGMLISCNASFRLYGVDHSKPTHYQRDDLTKMAVRDGTKAICAWIPSHYSIVQVIDGNGNRIDEIEQDTKLVVRQGLVKDITHFSDKHFHFYERTVQLNKSLLNFTGFQSNINHEWEDLVEHKRPLFRMNTRSGFFELGMTIVVAIILCLYALKLVQCLRRRYGRPSAREAADVRDRVEYDRVGQSVNLSTSPHQPPPPSRNHTEPKYRDPRSENREIEDCPGPDTAREPHIDPVFNRPTGLLNPPDLPPV